MPEYSRFLIWRPAAGGRADDERSLSMSFDDLRVTGRAASCLRPYFGRCLRERPTRCFEAILPRWLLSRPEFLAAHYTSRWQASLLANGFRRHRLPFWHFKDDFCHFISGILAFRLTRRALASLRRIHFGASL